MCENKLTKYFGKNEYGLPDVPMKMSSIKAAAVHHNDSTWTVYDDKRKKKWFSDIKCWKRHRKTQYRIKDKPNKNKDNSYRSKGHRIRYYGGFRVYSFYDL